MRGTTGGIPLGQDRSAQRSRKSIRKHKHITSEVCMQRRLPIVAGQDAISPGEQIGVEAGEFLPVCGFVASHAFTYQKKECAGNGFVVELRLAVGDGESLQRAGKFLESGKGRILVEICESQVYVIGVVK